MTTPETTTRTQCAHCGEDCREETIRWQEHSFCCTGCQTVYEILHNHDLCAFYQIDQEAGRKVEAAASQRYAFLDHAEVREQLLDFAEGDLGRVTLFVPLIHCSSCIWLLENLHRLNPAVRQSTVHFTKKEVTILFDQTALTLRELAEILSSVGYAPDINLASTRQRQRKRTGRRLWYQIGVTGFCFGNTMLLSFPEYIGATGADQDYLNFFAAVSVVLSLPVFFYGAVDYLTSAYKSLRHGYINLDVPIALGILVLFGRSLYEIISQTGPGYLDSLAGLIFFLLLGKWFQSKTYASLSFERDYESYFPVGVTRLRDGQEENVLIKDLTAGDRIVIRNQELIPADAYLTKGEARIDYSFVTGEADPVSKDPGNLLYAGGRQTGGPLELTVHKPVENSYLTQLWNQNAFQKDQRPGLTSLADRIGRYFTLVVILIAAGTAAYWYFHDQRVMMLAVTAVLIVACPCALALAVPFTFGTTMRVFGRNGFFLKGTDVVEKMIGLTDVVFDKTGTITPAKGQRVTFVGTPLDEHEASLVRTLARNSTHPLSQAIYRLLDAPLLSVRSYRETPGSGVEGAVEDDIVRLGRADFVMGTAEKLPETRVHVSINGTARGYFRFENTYRPALTDVIGRLGNFGLHLLSGDNDRERERLRPLFGEQMRFRQQPVDKLRYVEGMQARGQKVLMVGDGLNDAGALRQADVGIALADDVFHFSPACDAILQADSFDKLARLVRFTRQSFRIVKVSFGLSFLYNIVGLSFAVTGLLTPLVSAILMPLSSITVVAFATLAVNLSARRLGL